MFKINVTRKKTVDIIYNWGKIETDNTYIFKINKSAIINIKQGLVRYTETKNATTAWMN